MNNYSDEERYQWLKDNILEVPVESKISKHTTKWMLPRLIATDSSGRHYSLDEIIDIQISIEKNNNKDVGN